jgi:hypothetical protein
VLTCRDSTAQYADRPIEGADGTGTRIYGADGGQEASLVMKQMLTDHGFYAGDLVSLATPDQMVEKYPVGGVSVFEAIRRLAQSAGRDVRHFPGSSALTYYEPDRGKLLYDLWVMPSKSIKITDLSWGIEDVRNWWRVWYQDADGVPQGPVEASDSDSIDRYYYRPARVYLNRIENVRTTAQAQVFTNSALADSKDPFASHKINLPFLPSALLNDLHKYQGFGGNAWLEHDSDLFFALVGLQHVYRAKTTQQDAQWRTTAASRGKPLAAYRDYRKTVDQMWIASTATPTTEWAPEGAVWYPVTDLAPA